MAVMDHFDLEKPPSTGTIYSDLQILEREGATRVDLDPEAERLLLPDNFPEWRQKFFRAPGNKEYETPRHQLAWFYLVRALALKESPPDWVVEYLGLVEAMDGTDIREWAEKPESMLTMFLLAPPRHGKSDLAAHVIIWLICRNPDVRILWCGGKLEISELTTAFVKRELEANEALIEAYGPWETEGDWSNGQFTVATRKTRMRSPTLKAVSKGATILSLDADMIFLDDVFDQKSSESPTQVQKDIRWVLTQLFTRREPWTPVFGIGSHQPTPTGDAYGYMEKEQDNEIYFVKQKAHDYTKCKPLEDGMGESDRHGEWCLLWSTVRHWGYLEQTRKALGDINFEVCYNQDEQSASLEYFREKVIRGDYPQPIIDNETGAFKEFNHYEQKAGILDRHRTTGMPMQRCCSASGTLKTTIGFDPAAGQRKGTSESALVVLQGCIRCRRRYVVDYWHKRQSPEQHPDTIGQYAQIYNPQRVRIEINAYQKALARDPRLKEASLQNHFIIDEWFTGESKYDPTMGIPLLSRHMEQGRFSVPYQLPQDKHHWEAFLTQLVRYPSEPNDVVMALWLAELSMEDLLGMYNVSVPTVWDPNAPAHIAEQVVTIPLS